MPPVPPLPLPTVGCAADEPTCAPLLASMTLDRSGFEPIPAGWDRKARRAAADDDVDESSAGYKLGNLVGSGQRDDEHGGRALHDAVEARVAVRPHDLVLAHRDPRVPVHDLG